MNAIYLDNNSTTKIDPQVAKVMAECLEHGYANPASQHRPGQAARAELERHRRLLLDLLEGHDRQTRLILTSGGTESNNLAILRAARSADSQRPRVIVSAIEHPSVHGPAEWLRQQGVDVVHAPVDSDGCLLLDEFESLLTPETVLVSIMLVNNETGVIQPIKQAASICRERNVPLHCDAVQAVGKVPLSFRDLGLAAMTVTAHKLHGPRGIGGLIVDESQLQLHPIMFGGFQQLGIRPGTEDVALAAGFAKCVELAVEDLQVRADRMRGLRDLFEELVHSQCTDVIINGGSGQRAPHTSNLSFPGVDRQALLLAVDAAGVAISTGSACASGSSDPSPVLIAMGCSQEVIQGSIRVSLSVHTDKAEIDQAASRITKAAKHLRHSKSFRKSP